MPKNILEDLEAIEKRTQEIEAEKEAKRAEREEKKRLKALAKKKQAQEKWVAPVLLLLTILISYTLYLFYSR